MSDQGWIKLYRKIQSSFVWTNSDQLKLWLLILMKANHSQNKFLFNGQEIVLNSGQLVTGRAALTLEMNQGVQSGQQVNSTSVWRWLKKFESEQMLDIKSTSKYSVVTVLNWGEYQQSEHQVNINRTSNEHQVDTNKNDKNKEKKDTSSKPTIDYQKIVDYLNAESGHKYHVTDKTRGLIRARIAEKFTEHDFGLVIHYKSLEWKDNPDMAKYLRPNTLFGATHFDDYVNEARAAQQKQPQQRPAEPPHLTTEAGSAGDAQLLAELEEKYKQEGDVASER
ncbi:conserved phage C-terminal domain-containing protein [Levilactobacillus namurensis]|uniref:conserved phage C-terminal domain-containing protein n=1 Tax=Levilactobacillus namurensis TaxID=380393 RepID=UPI0004660BB2|nr:conserved phage C-terminal domain-containing protein [Levilactobacillus namurensis]